MCLPGDRSPQQDAKAPGRTKATLSSQDSMCNPKPAPTHTTHTHTHTHTHTLSRFPGPGPRAVYPNLVPSGLSPLASPDGHLSGPSCIHVTTAAPPSHWFRSLKGVCVPIVVPLKSLLSFCTRRTLQRHNEERPPDWFVPKTLPSLRSSRSMRANSKPSLVLATASTRSYAVVPG